MHEFFSFHFCFATTRSASVALLLRERKTDNICNGKYSERSLLFVCFDITTFVTKRFSPIARFDTTLWFYSKQEFYCCRTANDSAFFPSRCAASFICEFAFAIACHSLVFRWFVWFGLVHIIYPPWRASERVCMCRKWRIQIGGIEPIRNETPQKLKENRHLNRIHLLCSVASNNTV